MPEILQPSFRRMEGRLFGPVLQAIRESPFRAEPVGRRIVVDRTLAIISAVSDTFVGSLRTRAAAR